MPSIITIALVYENKNMSTEINNIITSILGDKCLINKIEYSLDNEGEMIKIQNFITKKELNLKSLSDGYNQSIEIYSDRFLKTHSKIVIRVEKNEEYYGILIDLLELDFRKNKFFLSDITESVINYVDSLKSISEFSYAFCDHDCNLEYSPLEFRKNYANSYSLIFLRKGTGIEADIEIKYSSWHIDGHTTR